MEPAWNGSEGVVTEQAEDVLSEIVAAEPPPAAEPELPEEPAAELEPVDAAEPAQPMPVFIDEPVT